MTHLLLTTHFDAPVERVFELGTDFKRYPEWNVNYAEVMDVMPEPIGVGTKIHGRLRILGREIEGWGEVTAFERNHLVTLVSKGPDGTSVITYRATPAPTGTGTDLECEIDYEPAGLLREITTRLFLESTLERDMRHSLENFKARVESREALLV